MVRIAGTPLARLGFGFARGPPSSRSTTAVALAAFSAASMPAGGRNGCSQRPSSAEAIIQPSYTRRKYCGADGPFRISARVFTTRCQPAAPLTGTSTGAPSTGTKSAGVWLISTRGGVLSTAMPAGSVAVAASDAWMRSSATRCATWPSAACSCGVYDAPRSASSGKSRLATFRSANATMRVTRSTCVRAVTVTTP